MKLITFITLLWFTACAPHQPPPEKPEPRPDWLIINKWGDHDVPDSPEQVCITLQTRDGLKWVAVWEQAR